MALHNNTFNGGLDLDSNPNSYSNTHYPYALNMRIFSSDSNTSSTLSSMEDSELIFNIPNPLVIVGLGTMRNNLVIFAIDNSVKLSPSIGNIYYIPFDNLVNGLDISNYLKVRKQFGFSSNVSIVCRYETPTIQKVYWIDENNSLRFANLALSFAELNAKDLTEFNVNREVTLSTPTLSSITTGTLKSGVYQYAYAQYNLGGAETGYSTASKPIPISLSSLTESTSLLFRGSNIGEISNKGIVINISDIDTNFDRIRVVRLFYEEQNGTPEVDIIYEGVSTSSLTVTDSGQASLGSLIINDYRYIPNIFTAKTLETKNDYLFAGNISEDVLNVDFDARAYRFRNAPAELEPIKASVWADVDPEYAWWDKTYLNINTTTWEVPEEYSCVNPLNIIEQDTVRGAALKFKYQKDGITLGGTGKYISFGFTTTSRIADSGSADNQPLRVYTNSNSNGYQDLSNPLVIHSNLGYQRDEIYRFAVVFYDKYGRQSYAKWIADIRFPYEKDPGYAMSDGNNIGDIGIVFTINEAGKSLLETQGIVSWQIVRTERTYDDATVKDCGYISSLYNNGSKMSWRDYPAVVSSDSDTPLILEYITPETNYNKNNYSPYDRLDIWPFHVVVNLTSKNNNTKGATSVTFKFFGTTVGYSTSVEYRTILKSQLFKHSNEETFTSLFSLGYPKELSNRFGPMYGRDNRSYDPRQYNRCTKGTTLLLQIKDTPPSNGIKYVRRRSFAYPYGGAGFGSRLTSKYYPCSDVSSINTTTKTVFGGDCYIGWFEYLRGVWSTDKNIIDSSSAPRMQNLSNQIGYFLVETKINLKYTVNPTWSYYDDGVIADYYSSGTSALATANYAYNAMREVRGVYPLSIGADGVTSSTDYYTQEFDLYTYNPVYSQMDKSKVFIPEPTDIIQNNKIDTRIYRTGKKINGENSDTWTKFPINNLLDVDTAYGGLTKLLTFNNTLYFIQNSAIGVIPIEEREVITTNSGSATSIGTGGVMQRYDYISTVSGCVDGRAITHSNKTIYFIDSINNKLCRISNGVEYISDLYGLKSLTSSANYSTIRTLFNNNYNEVWFKLTNDVVVFNEYTNSFITFTDENFTNSVNCENRVFILGTGGTFRKLDVTNTYKDVELHLIVNPNSQITNRFDSITVSSTVDINDIIQDKSFSTISLHNNYQQKDSSTFYPPARKRFRQFIYNDMRNTSDGARLFDSYLKIKLAFTKSNSAEKIKVHDILTNYTPINLR